VGFDNVSYTDYFGVPLTTVEQHRHEIGATATTLLLDRIAGRRTRLGRVVIATRLIVRRSSGDGPGKTSRATAVGAEWSVVSGQFRDAVLA
jgi:LacI family purine nucleotide synthesis repressor